MSLGPRRTAVALLLLLSLAGTGCFAGPSPLSRRFDGWVEERATEKPRLHGSLLQDVLPVYPMLGGVLGFLDWVVMNPLSFWVGGFGEDEDAPVEPVGDLEAPPVP